jgi:hypothetical protein
MVTARFTVREVRQSSYTKSTPRDGVNPKNGYVTEKVEMRTIVMSPVYSNDSNDPNKKFWDASPSGEIQLGTINPDAWRAFELDGLYEVTFRKIDAPAPT